MAGFQAALNSRGLKTRGRKSINPIVIPTDGRPLTYNQQVEKRRLEAGLPPTHEVNRQELAAKGKPVPPSEGSKPKPADKWTTLTPDPPDPATVRRERELAAIRQTAQTNAQIAAEVEAIAQLDNLAGALMEARPLPENVLTLDDDMMAALRDVQDHLEHQVGFRPTLQQAVLHVMRMIAGLKAKPAVV